MHSQTLFDPSTVIIVPPPRIKSHRPSVSQSISHPSIQSASAEPSWSNQSGQVMWEMKRKRQIHSQPWGHDPHIVPLWLTSWLLSSFQLHSPVSLSSQPPPFKLSTHIFTQSGLRPIQGHKLSRMNVVSFLLSLSGVHSQFTVFLDNIVQNTATAYKSQI